MNPELKNGLSVVSDNYEYQEDEKKTSWKTALIALILLGLLILSIVGGFMLH